MVGGCPVILIIVTFKDRINKMVFGISFEVLISIE